MPAPVISVAQMREWERLTWAAKRTPAEVISRVGHIVAAYSRQLTRRGDSILILAGKGHNGDDARQVVQNLADREVTLVNVREPDASLKEFESVMSLPQSLIIEGVFGIGLKGTLDPAWVRFLDALSHAPAPILAIDVPAGLNADTGQPQGTAVRARYTLTLGAPKKGLISAGARPYVGRVDVAPDIGLVPCPHKGDLWWTHREDFSHFPPPRPADGHKGTFGHLLIFAGSLGYHGAAVLAARGGLRAQPGLVTLVVPEDIYVPVAGQLQAAMVRPWRQGMPLPDSCTAVLFGPGFAGETLPADLRGDLVKLWKESPCPVIVDASALTWLPPGRISSQAPRIITPHPGEAARMLSVETAGIETDRKSALFELSRRWSNAWVVLKGYQTAIGRYRNDVFINCSGNPLLAQGGSGDVLAGYLGGLLAQPALQSDPQLTLRYGVWQHGATADQLSMERRNWTLEDLLAQLGGQG